VKGLFRGESYLPKAKSCLDDLTHARLGAQGAQESCHYTAYQVKENDDQGGITQAEPIAKSTSHACYDSKNS
jgi:hypothetical protein